MDSAKLSKLQAGVRIGGKGTPRRKVKKPSKAALSAADEKKVQTSLKKLNMQALAGIQEVNMFKEDGNVINFQAPTVHASLPNETVAIYGKPQEKSFAEILPGVLNNLGPESLAALRKMAEQLKVSEGKADGEAGKDADGDIPDLVEKFDEQD
ncbi:nascent polypeptide-associated complex beta subunit [Schizosaccharomyces japonicus yFS275]|uniref:Nascent polypeptide-associated complex subunit beta n=1 Tax=Schizosaccharomyces japonicus (strain yFS275 / FY16936) TaxID=402676 RepID=B6JYR6_SCHJY|nr:nascent polypeptide-associated complex beta subunit [Schizosaccharomyces japonicus yFS275]EEB06684.1 nascent polypeptide-associated complex beta subunit [Schizosaccharomyces japonicus yFS275]